ncbi:MAG: GTP cyclohydrolase I FolE [Acidobacteria bacterium]|nr:GTP cyclohydrolase I FolE [Acidobacteriota bacterium]
MSIKPPFADAQTAWGAVLGLLYFIGEDPQRDGLRDTPARVARSLKEMTRGYAEDPRAILSATFDLECDEIVTLRGVRFASLCEHHLLPFTGIASVGYLPDKRVVGISKLARLVQCFARRLQIQERLTQQVAEAIQSHLEPRGVGVIIRAHHHCMGCRGIHQPDAEMVTSAMYGMFRDSVAARAEFMHLANGR